MARLLTCAYVAMGTLVAQQVAPLALLHIPVEWGYRLTPTCYWKPLRWTSVLGPNPPPHPIETPAVRRQVWSCEHSRGLKSMVIFHAHLETHWPDRATLAKWEAEDAQKLDPSPPDWSAITTPD